MIAGRLSCSVFGNLKQFISSKNRRSLVEEKQVKYLSLIPEDLIALRNLAIDGAWDSSLAFYFNLTFILNNQHLYSPKEFTHKLEELNKAVVYYGYNRK